MSFENVVFVNASAAKSGGALTILNLFCRSKNYDEHNFYYVASPIKPIILPKNCKWLRVSTSGLFSALFSLLLCNFYYFLYGCNKLVSFSNINSILPIKNRVTYFHNILICDSKLFKYKLIRFALKYLNQRECKYIFQTRYVRDRFDDALICDVRYMIAWPGLNKELLSCMPQDSIMTKLSSSEISCHSKTFIVPIVNINDAHKNFNLLLNIVEEVSKRGLDITFNVTANHPVNEEKLFNKHISFIGELTHRDFIEKISISDGVLICSSKETLCLPIFEAVCKKKPAIVLNAEYISGLHEQFGKIPGMFLFNDVTEVCDIMASDALFSVEYTDSKIYVDGDWEF